MKNLIRYLNKKSEDIRFLLSVVFLICLFGFGVYAAAQEVGFWKVVGITFLVAVGLIIASVLLALIFTLCEKIWKTLVKWAEK